MNTQTAPAPLLAWEAPSLPKHQRSPRWYLVGGALVILFAVYGFLSGNWSFAVVCLLTGGMYYVLRNAVPQLHRIEISETGFRFDDRFTAWRDCTEFWLLTVPSHTELHLLRKRGWDRHVVIQTGLTDDSALRDTLSRYLPERSDARERLPEILARLLQL